MQDFHIILKLLVNMNCTLSIKINQNIYIKKGGKGTVLILVYKNIYSFHPRKCPKISALVVFILHVRIASMLSFLEIR